MNWAQKRLWIDVLQTVPDGHVPMYSQGQRYAYCVIEALLGDVYRPDEVLEVAQEFVGPLIDVNEQDDLRDFIAGLASGIERAAIAREGSSPHAR